MLFMHNEVKDVFRDYDFIYTDGSVSDDKAAAAAVIDNYFSIEHLPDKSSIFSAELHALYLDLDRVEMADDDERIFVIFSVSKSALQAISGQDWTHLLVLYILERFNWLVQYQEKRILFYWIPSHVGIRGNEKADAAAKAGLSRRVTNVPIPYGDFKNYINVDWDTVRSNLERDAYAYSFRNQQRNFQQNKPHYNNGQNRNVFITELNLSLKNT